VRGAGFGSAVAVALAACILPVRAAGVPPLRSMALQRSDLPRGSVLDAARTWTDAQAATADSVSVSLYRTHGRVLSFANEFDRPQVLVIPHGILRADSEVTAFKTSADAAWGFRFLRNHFRHTGVLGTTTGGTKSGSASHTYPYHEIVVRPLANQDAAFFAASCGDEYCYDTHVLLFRRRQIVVQLRVAGIQNEVPFAAVMRIARHIDVRVLAAHGGGD
jgi:hypothetical protein